MIIEVDTDVIEEVGQSAAIVLAAIKSLSEQDLVKTQLVNNQFWIQAGKKRLQGVTHFSQPTISAATKKLKEFGYVEVAVLESAYGNNTNWFRLLNKKKG